MTDSRTWPTARSKTDLAGQFEELRKERDKYKSDALWLHGKYLNEEAKAADQMDRAEAAEARVKELEAESKQHALTATRFMEEAVKYRDERNALIDELADLYQERWDYGDDEEWFAEEVTK